MTYKKRLIIAISLSTLVSPAISAEYKIIHNAGEKFFEFEELYDFNSHTFTNCGKEGRYGPSLSQCKNSYSEENFDINNIEIFNVNDGVQTWTVPKTAEYRITAYGAEGATGSRTGTGGRGAKISGVFLLEQNNKIDILVGQKGTTKNNLQGPSGGGGSFVIKNGAFQSGNGDEQDIYLIAGGGGAFGVGSSTSYSNRAHGRTVESAGSGRGGTARSSGGSNGNGGGATGNRAGAGGGFLSDGGDGTNNNSGGKAFLNGGLGGDGHSHNDGGFGGGGATDQGTSWGATGGGGGYSGGGGGYSDSDSDIAVGGGGGSYNAGNQQEQQSNYNSGHGKVTISIVE